MGLQTASGENRSGCFNVRGCELLFDACHWRTGPTAVTSERLKNAPSRRVKLLSPSRQ